jgi:hypothetical protein
MRPDNQALEPAIDNILTGINIFNLATKERIKSGEWQDEHIEKLNKLRKKFIDLEVELEILKEETW